VFAALTLIAAGHRDIRSAFSTPQRAVESVGTFTGRSSSLAIAAASAVLPVHLQALPDEQDTLRQRKLGRWAHRMTIPMRWVGLQTPAFGSLAFTRLRRLLRPVLRPTGSGCDGSKGAGILEISASGPKRHANHFIRPQNTGLKGTWEHHADFEGDCSLSRVSLPRQHLCGHQNYNARRGRCMCTTLN